MCPKLTYYYKYSNIIQISLSTTRNVKSEFCVKTAPSLTENNIPGINYWCWWHSHLSVPHNVCFVSQGQIFIITVHSCLYHQGRFEMVVNLTQDNWKWVWGKMIIDRGFKLWVERISAVAGNLYCCLCGWFWSKNIQFIFTFSLLQSWPISFIICRQLKFLNEAKLHSTLAFKCVKYICL